MYDDEPIICQLIFNDFSEHSSNYYSSIWGKELYPVAFNPLDETGRSVYNMNVTRCTCKGKYTMIR